VPLNFKLSDRGRLIVSALAVAIVTMAAIILAVVFVPAQYAEKIQGKWVRFALMTIFFFVFSMKSYWKERKSMGFWGIFLSFLALHIFGLGHLWAVDNGLSTLEVALAGGAEFVLMALVIYWLLGVGPDPRPHRSKSPWIPEV
jgi:hypothetical protein